MDIAGGQCPETFGRGRGQTGGTMRSRGGRRAVAPVPDGTAGERAAEFEAHDGASGTAGRTVPRRIQPEQPDVPVRRKREARGRSADRHGHRPLRVTGARPVLFSVHEHGSRIPGRALGPDFGRVLCGTGYGRFGPERRLRAGPGVGRRRNARARLRRGGSSVIFLALDDEGTEFFGCLVVRSDGRRRFDAERSKVWRRKGHGRDRGCGPALCRYQVCRRTTCTTYAARVVVFSPHVYLLGDFRLRYYRLRNKNRYIWPTLVRT